MELDYKGVCEESMYDDVQQQEFGYMIAEGRVPEYFRSLGKEYCMKHDRAFNVEKSDKGFNKDL